MELFELFLVLLALLAGAWVIVGPVLVFVLWGRVRRLNQEFLKLRYRVAQAEQRAPETAPPRTQREPPPEAAEPLATPTAPPASDIWLADEPAPPPRPAAEPPRLPARPGPRPATPTARPALAAASAPAAAMRTGSSITLEELLAGKWLTWVGAVAVVVGVGFFLKYAIDNEWIGEGGRVALGLIGGMGCFAGGAFAMLRGYRWLSQGLVGAALGILYFSLFAASFKMYDLIGVEALFAGMVLVTVAALAFSAYFDALATAILGLLGGFLTPLMLSTGQDAQWFFFSYLLILDAGVLGVATFRKWQSLQVLAFVGSLVMWIGWFGQHYAPEKLQSTVVLMTAFFLLFALLGIWHNVLRKVPAVPGDFFLILATPIAYFVGLYGVTEARYAFLHGLLAIALAGTYLGFGVLSLSRNPAGKNVVVALGGIAASFLTVAIPLQLTGHWIAIAWACEALLLVELGLRFQEWKLRLAGFGLLVVVQLILVSYSIETIADPVRFSTRFTREPAVVEVMPTAPGAAVASARPPTWLDVFNGRSLSFLASAIALGVIAWEYRRRGLAPAIGPVSAIRRRREEPTDSLNEGTLAGALLALIPVVVLGMLLVETFAAGAARRWLFPSYVSAFAFWSAAVGLAVLAFGSLRGPRWMQTLGLGAFGLAGLFLAIVSLNTLAQWRSQYHNVLAGGQLAPAWKLFLFNPRGLGFVSTIAAAVAGALLLRRSAEPDETKDADGLKLDAAPILGVFAHLTGLAMLTIETYAQGVVRGWDTGTALAITGVWTLYAIATLAAGIVVRSRVVRVLALALFLLTTAKVFLYDVWEVDKAIRFIAFVGLGVSLLLVSFLYRRFRDRIRAWMAPAAIGLAIAGIPSPTNAWQAPEEPSRRIVQSLERRWVLETPEAADVLRSIALPLDVYGAARLDLGDLRVFVTDVAGNRAHEVPYVLSSPTDVSRVVVRPAPMLNLSQKGTRTEFVLDLSQAVEPVNSLAVDIRDDERNYERKVSVYGSNRLDGDEWNLLTDDGYLLDVTRPGHRLRVVLIEFPPSRFAYYRVVIANRDQPPLHVEGARLSDVQKTRIERRRHPAKIVSTELDEQTRESQIVLDLEYDRLPTLSLELAIDYDGAFYRPVQLEATDSLRTPVAWSGVVTGQIYRIERPDLRKTQTSLDYPEIRSRYLRVTISNGDDRPLVVSGATALGIDKRVVFEDRELRRVDGTAALYAGNHELSAPRYDLARTIGAITPQTGDELTLGRGEPNPYFTGPFAPGKPWSERNQALLWTATIAGVVILGGLTALLLKQAANRPPDGGTQ